MHKRRSIELAQLCQDQKRKDFEKQNELKEVEKLIRGKNDQLEEWKIRVKQFSDKTKKVGQVKSTLEQFPNISSIGISAPFLNFISARTH